MSGTHARRRISECVDTIAPGRTAEVTPERPGKYLVTGEPRRDGDVKNRVVTGGEPRRSPLQTQAKRVLLRRLTDQVTQRPVEVKSRPSRPPGHNVERQVPVQTAADVAEHAQEIAIGRHRGGNDRRCRR